MKYDIFTYLIWLNQINCVEIYEDANNMFSLPKRLSSGLYTIEVNGEEELIVKKGIIAETRR